MCGIAGIWNYKSGRPANPDTVRRITRTVAHRGPDGEGFYWGPGPALGHRRLSIIDVERGRQPMCNEDETVWLVYNGEIYNYLDLRHELTAHGHLFRTNSDSETIVHLYEEYGESCFEKLRGMFALALWDSKRQRLLLARDRLGIKPLFYSLSGDGIVFGSELKCIRESGQIAGVPDTTAIADLFTFFYIPGPKTIYRDVFSLDPGHYLVVNRHGVIKRRYWDLTDDRLELTGEKEYEERLYEILEQSVRSHLLSDVPVGAFLSGGLDSSAIVALMSRFQSRVVTCSIGFDECAYDESTAARDVARQFETEHYEQTLTAEATRILTDLAASYDQPFPDHSSIPTYFVSRLAARQVKVVLSGDGGDEIFAGYSRYLRHRVLQQMRRVIPSPLLNRFRGYTGKRLNSLPYRLARVLHQLGAGAREGYLHALTITDPPIREELFSDVLQHELAGYDPLDHFREIYDRSPLRDPLSCMLYLDMKTSLVDDILTKVDRASMANSLEVRVPLLDHKLVEFAYSLPENLKLRGDKGKYLLRGAMRRHFSEQHLDRPKRGFRLPIDRWLHSTLAPWAEKILFETRDTEDYLCARSVRRIWRSYRNGEHHLADIVAILLSFAASFSVWRSDSMSNVEG